MHCGLCLPTCPTYVLTGREKSSPRGRIRLMKAVADGEIEITNGFVEEMDFCLDCQACETACPAGVKYGSLVESARDQISKQHYGSWITRVLKRLLLRTIFEDTGRLVFVARLLRMFQMSRLDSLLKRTGILRVFSKRLHQVQYLAPRVSAVPSSKLLAKSILSSEQKKFRVGFLTGCIMDVAFADINVDTVELLVHHGCEVVVPPKQGCCGSLQAHNGDFETARRFARHNVRVFSDLNLDAIIMNSAGCGAFMKEYGSVLKDDAEYAAPAADLAGKVKDISEFIIEIGLNINGKSSRPYEFKRVTYHDACHLVHSQKISEQPRRLIKSIPSIEYVELPESSWCCGSAGIYNITHYDTAIQLLDRKIENIKKVEPDIIVTGNPGCFVQLEYGLEREGKHIELLHLATFLRRAFCG